MESTSSVAPSSGAEEAFAAGLAWQAIKTQDEADAYNADNTNPRAGGVLAEGRKLARRRKPQHRSLNRRD